jgi:hypothetical protein
MADLKFQPVRHDHKAFLEKASKRRGFSEAYEALELEYALAREMLAARVSPRKLSPPAWERPKVRSPAWNPRASMPLR